MAKALILHFTIKPFKFVLFFKPGLYQPPRIIFGMNSRLGLTALAAVIVASGCVHTGPAGSSSGNFELLVSDAPAAIDDFESLEVTFSEARMFDSNDSSETFDVSGRTVDLTEVKGAKAESLLNASLEPGNYSKVELHVASTRGIVNGSEVAVKVPPEKLMITKEFEVRPNKTTEFVFDIQVVLRGNQQNNQGYILKPVISESGVVGKDVEVERRSERRDRPGEAGGPPAGAGR